MPIGYLNTSHVNVNPVQTLPGFTPNANLNTSHVNVNPLVKCPFFKSQNRSIIVIVTYSQKFTK